MGIKEQSSVSLSTSKAEYIALSLAIQRKMEHRVLCEALIAVGVKRPDLVKFKDNQSCINVTKNSVNHGRDKHIDINIITSVTK